MTLPLSSPQRVSAWVGQPVDDRLVESLQTAREVITSRVVDFADETAIPASLHRAATMMAAATHERVDSTYGVEAFTFGGDAGAGFLVDDPTIKMLLAPHLAPAVGVSMPAASESA